MPEICGISYRCKFAAYPEGIKRSYPCGKDLHKGKDDKRRNEISDKSWIIAAKQLVHEEP